MTMGMGLMGALLRRRHRAAQPVRPAAS